MFSGKWARSVVSNQIRSIRALICQEDLIQYYHEHGTHTVVPQIPDMVVLIKDVIGFIKGLLSYL